MSTARLTLSADKQVIEKAKRVAQERGTSVSEMFVRFVEGLESEEEFLKSLGPNARAALGLVELPQNRDYKSLLMEAVAEKHREK